MLHFSVQLIIAVVVSSFPGHSLKEKLHGGQDEPGRGAGGQGMMAIIPLPRLSVMVHKLRAAVLAGTIALTGAPEPALSADPPPQPTGIPRIGGHFSLMTADGTEVTDRSFAGKWLLLYFGYTFCPDACPTALNMIAEALDELGPLAERIQPIFITVDPERDTPSVMAQYVKAFDPRLIGLAGTAAQIAAAAKNFHVFYRVRQLGNQEYAIDHSSYIYLVNPDGQVVERITSNMPGHSVAAELKRLIQ